MTVTSNQISREGYISILFNQDIAFPYLSGSMKGRGLLKLDDIDVT